MPTKLQIASKFAFCAKPQEHSCDAGKGLKVTVESDCFGRSGHMATDIALAIESGAIPAAHEFMLICKNEAENQERPLRCTIEFAP